MDARRIDAKSQPTSGAAERGSALVLALLVMIIMTLMGLAFMFAGEMESKIGVNKRDSEQALFIAEGGVRVVKKWFDAPSGSSAYLVPTASQIDRTARYVDDNADGTYGPYSSANVPYNVVYRQGTDDPFERPYRGTPAAMFLGTEVHPDLRISDSGGTGEKTYLASLNTSLFPGFVSGVQNIRIRQIDVYSPPIVILSGQRQRYGIATIKVTASVYEQAGTANERPIATRVAKAVVNQLPIPGPLGPLQSNVNIDTNGEFGVHWGMVTATRDIELPSNLTIKVPSGIPWYSRSRGFAPDFNGDGVAQPATLVGNPTPDDQDGNGVLDFDQWIAGNSIEDPWMRFISEGDVRTVTPGCNAHDCQPAPWYDGATFSPGGDNHSNIFKLATVGTFPEFEYTMFKGMAQSGGKNLYYYASDGAGTGTYKLNGSGASVSMRDASDGKNGFFFFDTATNTAPFDSGADGTYDNLAQEVQMNGGGYSSSGIIYLNADFATTGNGSAAARSVPAPGEPYIDANGNGAYDADEVFLDLNYPNSVGGNYDIVAARREMDGFTRQVPSKDAGSDGKYNLSVNMYGVFYTNGKYDAAGNWTYYGAMVTKGGMTRNGGSGTADIYFDDRLVTGAWPPPDIDLPRTTITAWETEL